MNATAPNAMIATKNLCIVLPSPSVTTKALTKFARVEISTLTRIGYATEKKADAARDVLDRVKEWSIDLHFDRRWTYVSRKE